MSSRAPLAWLPFDSRDLPAAPAGLRYDVALPGTDPLPPGRADVEWYCPPYGSSEEALTLIRSLPSLKVVQSLTAGVDRLRPHIPPGVLLCNGRGIHDSATAEHALTLTLSLLRRLPDLAAARVERRWASREWAPGLADRNVVVVGAGSIGTALASRLVACEANVHLVARTPRNTVRAVSDLPDLLPRADVVILLVPLTAETRGLVDRAFLARMKDGAALVNVARGAVVVTEDLVAEVATGRIRAALDVADVEPLPDASPLWDLPGLLLTPHVAANTDAMWPRARRLVQAQLERFATGEPLDNLVTGDY